MGIQSMVTAAVTGEIRRPFIGTEHPNDSIGLVAGKEKNLVGRVFLTHGFDARQDSQTHQHDAADHDPMGRYMHERGGVSQPADHNQVSKYVNSK